MNNTLTLFILTKIVKIVSGKKADAVNIPSKIINIASVNDQNDGDWGSSSGKKGEEVENEDICKASN